jgi:enoyl-CoA hydratase/carnithine racemase
LSYQQVLYEVSDAIATVTLNRPERHNAWTDVMARELHDAMRVAAEDRQVRVIVLAAAGKSFSVGADLDALANLEAESLVTKLPRPFDMRVRADYQTRCAYPAAVPKPIIAMHTGATAGIALLHALFCDVRFAAEDAFFTTAFARLGLSAEYGAAWILPRIVGHANALDMLLSGRRVEAREALRIGLVNRVHPASDLAAATYAYAREIAVHASPRSTRAIKHQVWEAPFQTLAEAAGLAAADMLAAVRSADFQEGLAAFREKRPPRFAGD